MKPTKVDIAIIGAGSGSLSVAAGAAQLGATIVGRHAGELILPWVLAVQKRLTVRDMATIIAHYPTLGEVSKRVAGAWYTPQHFSSYAPHCQPHAEVAVMRLE